MSEKMVNFQYDEDKYRELKIFALKNKINMKTLLSNIIEDYLKRST